MKFAHVLFFVPLLLGNARAEVIASCGGSAGKVYFVEGGAVSKEQSGFQNDKVSDGTISLTFENEELDVVYGDATGELYSSSKNGALVTPVSITEENIHVLVLYPGVSAETYMFRPVTGEVVWSQSRATSMISKVGIMRASCAFNLD